MKLGWNRRPLPIALPSHDLREPRFNDPPPGPILSPDKPPLGTRPFVRAGVYSWAAIGIIILLFAALTVLGRLTVVIVPLVIALFPAAVLVPPTQALKDRGVPDAAAAALTMVITFSLLGILIRSLAPQVGGELEGLTESLESGVRQVRRFIANGPLFLPPLPVDALFDRLQDRFSFEGGAGDITSTIVEATTVVLEGVTGVLFGLFALFFYLKDGPRIARWLRDLFPHRVRPHVQAIGQRGWYTIGAYIRGTVIIGTVDAVAIGIRLLILRIPLALPLAVLVFFGAQFPIVGALTAGGVAVLVALATNGPAAAFAVLILIVAVQQVEGHILTPILLGRATEMHPLAVIAALTAGAVLLGILGAFLAVPVTASIARAVSYLRERARSEPAEVEPAAAGP